VLDSVPLPGPGGPRGRGKNNNYSSLLHTQSPEPRGGEAATMLSNKRKQFIKKFNLINGYRWNENATFFFVKSTFNDVKVYQMYDFQAIV